VKYLQRAALVILTSLTVSVYAGSSDTSYHDTGFYLGLGGGAAWSSDETKAFTEVEDGVTSSGTSKLVDGAGFGARVFAGYQFHYFSLESAFTYASDFTENDIGTASIGAINIDFNSTDKSRLLYANLLGKVSYPFHFARIFAGAGMAVVFKDAKTRHTNVFTPGGVFISKSAQSGAHTTFVRPEITVGINRHISQHALIQLDYNRVFAKRNIGVQNAETNFLPNINTVLLNVLYVF